MSGSFKPTIPRGPISAMYSTPGPAYQLPGVLGDKNHDPRSVHNKAPAYSFGLKHGKFSDDASPGPKYHPNSKIYRDGKDGTPHYSLYSRHSDKNRSTAPGPGAYTPEGAKVMENIFHKAPIFSFGSRFNMRGTDNTPASNSYTLPGMLGKTVQSAKKQAPNYSITGRSKIGSFHEDLQKTPGPGNYNVPNPNTYKTMQPLYTMTARNTMPGDSTQKPGPGSHKPESVLVTKHAAPHFSFGIRHSAYEAPLIVEVKE